MNKKILIAEDDQFSANMYRLHLRKYGYNVSTTSDGHSTLEQLDSFQPDLVILDLIMPSLDGFGVLKYIHSSAFYKKLPVIVVSNLDQPCDINQCLELGANLFITKESLEYHELAIKIHDLTS